MNDDLKTAHLQPANEERLRVLLQQRASAARPSPSARAAVMARVSEQKRPIGARRRIAIAAAAAASVGAAWWSQSGPATLVTADGPRTTTTEQAAPQAPQPASRPSLPRLVLSDPRFSVDHIDETTSSPEVDVAGEIYTQVYRSASSTPAAPALTVRTIKAGAAYGIGEDAPPEVVERVDVGGREGFLVQKDSLSPSLGWRLADGTGVHLKAIGMPGDALVELARQMKPRSGAPGWDMPLSAMAPAVEGEVRYGGSTSSEVEYETADGGRVAIRVLQGDRLRFEDLVLDRADAASTYERVEIRGVEGVLFAIDDGYLALTYEDGIVTEVASTLSRAELEEVLASIEEVDEEEWQAMRAERATARSA